MLQVHEFVTGDHFAFCDPIHGGGSHIDCSEEVEVREWGESIEGTYGYLGGDIRLGALTGENFGNQAQEGHDPDGACPWLWKNASPSISQTYLMHAEHDGRCVCHNSRAQEIAKYRKEMMDMIQDVPEFAFELSLRDLVELPRVARAGLESPAKVKEQGKRKRAKRRPSRSENLENRSFLLKMFFPSHVGGKKSSGISCGCSKAAPKPRSSADAEKGGPDKNESGKSSRSSSTSSTSSSRRKMRGCYPFL